MIGFLYLGTIVPQQLEGQVLVVRNVEIRIELLVLIDGGQLHGISLATDVSSIGIFRQIRYPVHRRLDVTIT